MKILVASGFLILWKNILCIGFGLISGSEIPPGYNLEQKQTDPHKIIPIRALAV
jgi:hypothetical protein